MIDHYAHLDDEDLFPHGPLNLAARMRELRTRQGLKQSEIARRMGLDPSIPSLWEQGKRPVPANRVRSLAEALGVSTSELLEGVEGGDLPLRTIAPVARTGVEEAPPSIHAFRERGASLERSTLFTLVSAAPRPTPPAPPTPPPAPEPTRRRWEPQARPSLLGWIPDGWEAGDRVHDIGPDLEDGFWLDPVRLERPAARALLRARLCAADRALVEGQDVPGLVLAERLHRHCAAQTEGWQSTRLPLVEAIFRMVVASPSGGLAVGDLIEALGDRAGAVPVTRALLRRLGESILPYPLRWVDRDLFE